MLQGITKEATEIVKGNTSCLSSKVIKVEDSLIKIVFFYIEWMNMSGVMDNIERC